MEDGEREKKARKRGWSPSPRNYRLKRTLFMGKRRGSSTPVPAWKMIGSPSPSLQIHRAASAYLNGGNARDLTARKLAAVLWEIDGMPSSSSTLKSENFGEKNGGGGMAVKQRVMEPSKLRSAELGLSDPSLTTVFEVCLHSENYGVEPSKLRSAELGLSDPSLTTVFEGILDPSKLYSRRRRELERCRNSSNQNSGCSKQVDKTRSHANGLKTNLDDVYSALITSKQLVHLLSCVLENPECMSSTLVSALGVELDRSCNRVSKLFQGAKRQKSGTDVFPSIVGELETEKKLRRRSEKLTKKTEEELAETRASLTRVIKELESEKKARRKVEQVCEELARGVWELKSQFGKVREEVEREREMFQIADLLREERVQMKLSDARCLYEERNELVEKLRNQLEASLKGENKSRELEKLLKDSNQEQERERENDAAGNEIEGESDDSDLHSIELSMEEISKSFIWGNAPKNGSRRNSFDTSKGRIPRKQQYAQNQKPQLALSSQSKPDNYGFS